MQTQDLDNTILSVRLTRDLAERFWKIMNDVKARDPYIGKSVVIRDLFGVASPPVAVTDAELAYFRALADEGVETTRKPGLRKSPAPQMPVKTIKLGGEKKPAKDKGNKQRKKM